MPHPTALIADDPDAESPAPTGPSARPPRPWAERASRWLRAAAEALDPSGLDHGAVDAFADQVSQAREPDEVRVALVRLAGRVSGAASVELSRAGGGRGVHPLASWPGRPAPSSSGRGWTEHRGRPGLAGFRARRDRPDRRALALDLRSGGAVVATLHLTSSDGRPWPARAVRCLESLCAMAASAERALASPGRGAGDRSADTEGVPSGETTLVAFLSFAMAQARRRHEPLSLMTIEVDRLAAIRDLLGDGLADEAVDRVARAVRDALRASDVVARLESGRISAILPTASASDVARVAEGVRSAIARAGAATEAMPTLSATIGVASYPDHALDVPTLRAAASSALASARRQGHDRVFALEPAAVAV